jgi:hypothetical protein
LSSPGWVAIVPEAELLLRSVYRPFNARDIDAAIELMHPPGSAKSGCGRGA